MCLQVPGVYLAALGLIRTLVGPPAVLERRDCTNIVWELLPLLIARVRVLLDVKQKSW